MPHNQSCIIILKPTSFFLSFVTEQLSDFEQTEEAEMSADNTAYTMPSYDNDDALLEHLERLYPYMFQHEVVRLFGQSIASKINADFLDFMCCFKFEVYAEPLLMATSVEDCHQLVCVKPRVVSFDWMPTSGNDHIKVKGLVQTLDLFRATPAATALVKTLDKLDLKPLLHRYCKPLLKADLMKKAMQMIQWPTTQSWQMFNRYFAVEVHTQLVHLH